MQFKISADHYLFFSVCLLVGTLASPDSYAEDSDFDLIDQSLEYRFVENSAPEAAKDGKPAKLARSCDTGLKEFFSIEDFCFALMNDEENNFCAKKEREAKFKESNCSKIPAIELEKSSQPKKRKSK